MSLETLVDRTRITVKTLPPAHRLRSFEEAVRSGLGETPKRIPPMYFYDARGSQLFERICTLPEYYLTRTEQTILDEWAHEMVVECRRQLAVVELGSGNCSKTRTFLEALFASGHDPVYSPIDISEFILRESAEILIQSYPQLEITAIASDYFQGLEEISQDTRRQKVFLFLGSNMGNFSREEAVEFLRAVRQAMAPGDVLFIGLDMQKSLDILIPAYDDDQGVTAAFNLNLLERINTQLGGTFDPGRFEHTIRWNGSSNAIEMHLRSAVSQSVRIEALDLQVDFKVGETIHTENSHKYTSDELEALCRLADLQPARSWSDDKGYFSVNLIKPNGSWL